MYIENRRRSPRILKNDDNSLIIPKCDSLCYSQHSSNNLLVCGHAQQEFSRKHFWPKFLAIEKNK